MIFRFPVVSVYRSRRSERFGNEKFESLSPSFWEISQRTWPPKCSKLEPVVDFVGDWIRTEIGAERIKSQQTNSNASFGSFWIKLPFFSFQNLIFSHVIGDVCFCSSVAENPTWFFYTCNDPHNDKRYCYFFIAKQGCSVSIIFSFFFFYKKCF